MGGTCYVPDITPFTGHANEDGGQEDLTLKVKTNANKQILVMVEVRVCIICFTYENDKLCLKADDRSSTRF